MLKILCIHITRVENFNVLNSLNHNKAVGIDDIGPSILRFCGPALLCLIISHMAFYHHNGKFTQYSSIFLNNKVNNNHSIVHISLLYTISMVYWKD